MPVCPACGHDQLSTMRLDVTTDATLVGEDLWGKRSVPVVVSVCHGCGHETAECPHDDVYDVMTHQSQRPIKRLCGACTASLPIPDDDEAETLEPARA